MRPDMKVLGVIPARYASTRLPGKPLVDVAGKPLLQWVIEGSKSSQKISEIVVATDHEAIVNLAQKCGVTAIMTDPNLPSGSDRVWAAAKGYEADLLINIQGDEPLITGQLLDSLVEPFESDIQLEMATLGRELNNEDLKSPNTAKIVLNIRQEALYFSRFPIPYSRALAIEDTKLASLKHIGLYAYRAKFLETFCKQAPTALENYEGLEQLRALYLGARIKVVKVDHDSWGVDTPDDIAKIERLLEKRNKNGC